MTKEQLEKEIKTQKEIIEDIKSHNPDSGELSFLYWQLHELEKELKGKDNE